MITRFASPRVALARVVASTDTARARVYQQFTLTFRTATDQVLASVYEFPFCGPHAPRGSCGA